jgi:uncharacterized membrane protein YphA (DoxX/SURF4 family)
VKWLFMALFVEGLALCLFSRMTVLPLAIATMIVFSLFVQMSEGATYSVVPFINKKALGSVSGIVGAGGNLGAVAAGFLFKACDTTPQFLLILGGCVFVISFFAFAVTFSASAEKEVEEEFKEALKARKEEAARRRPSPIQVAGGLPGLIRVARPMDLLRMYLGVALAVKGIYFIMNMGDVEKLGGIGHFSNLVAWYVVAAHVIGGACMFVGLATRVASFFNITVLLGAIFFVHMKEGLFAASQGMEFSLFVFFTLCLLMWKGSGNLSLDKYMEMNEDNEGDGGLPTGTV